MGKQGKRPKHREGKPVSYFCSACSRLVETWTGSTDPDERAAIAARRCSSCARSRSRAAGLPASTPGAPRPSAMSKLSDRTRALLQPYDASKPVLDEDWR